MQHCLNIFERIFSTTGDDNLIQLTILPGAVLPVLFYQLQDGSLFFCKRIKDPNGGCRQAKKR